MRVLLVEDDYLQAQWVGLALKREFKEVQVETISSELGFRRRAPELAREPPDVVIMDIMMPWTDPSPDMEQPPPDVCEGGPFRAGLRCEELLAKYAPDIPVVFYTVLEAKDIEEEMPQAPQVSYLSKESDPSALFQRIRQRVRRERG